MSSPTVQCTQCGALNGADFGRCIRCSQPLGDALPADKARRRVPARRVRGHGAPVGTSTEPLLGRWPAETLPMTKAILSLTLLVFAGQAVRELSHGPSLRLLWGGNPIDAVGFGAMLIHLPLVAAEPWRLLSACFVHYGLIHVGMNMLALVHLSRLAEPAVGSVRLLIAYVVSGVLGFATTLAYGALSGAALAGSTAGASGAIFGLMGLVLGFLLRRRDPRWKAWLGQAVMFSLLFGFAMPGVNNSAHVGGLAVGLLFGLGFAKGAPRPSARWQRVLAALLVVAVLGSLVLALRSPLPELLRAQFGDG